MLSTLMFAALQLAERTISGTLAARGYQPGSCTDGWSPEVAAEVATRAMLRRAIAAATGAPASDASTPIPATRDGPYSPELAEAFRQGARELLNCNLGDRINVDTDARVEEYEPGDGGAIVHCTIYVGDGERAALAADDDGCPKLDPDCMGKNGDCHDACVSPEGEA
jgi:hypothetical protein